MSTDRYTRWRLILGRAADQDLCRAAGRTGLLSGDEANLDEALGQIYENKEESTTPKQRSAGLGASAPRLAKWLGDIRGYFSKDVVSVIQKDAIERRGLKQLLFEPETLGQVTPDVGLVGTLLSLKNMIPDRAKDAAREVVRAVVEEIMKRLRGGMEQAVRGALDRSRHGPMRSLPNLDWARTIRRNLKNYDRERKVVIPETFHFFARQHRRKEWNVIVCMDQSGSMADSVVYGGVTGAIFASMPALETHVIVFDTEVVDLTEKCHDPVDLLFGVQLGGGTDINRAVAYCQKLIQDPRKTLFILITDLFEGGNARELVRRMDDLHAAGVRAICLLALSDSGVPCHDEGMARRFTEVGVPCFGCTPKMLPLLLEGTLKGQDLFKLAKACGVQVKPSSQAT
ncbi:MAG TPA: VWA domain-containing protein [Gemmataceae bacterium]|nr:VWA domain-containing protein [Gemmataceae bacterium]